MEHDVRKEIDSIATNYFKSTIVLFETVSFFNNSITSVHTDKNEKMTESYKKLEKILSEQQTDIPETGLGTLLLTHMPSLCFSSLVSAFENYLIEILALALTTFPHKISKESVDLKKVIELTKEEIILFKAKEHINQIMYKSPKDYLKALSNLLSLNESEITTNFNKYIEIKARRDLGVHNNWRRNEIYDRKIADAGIEVSAKSRLAPSFDYYKYAFQVCSILVENITKQCCANLFKVPSVFHNKEPIFDTTELTIPKEYI